MERAPDEEGGCFLLGTGLCGLGHGDLEEWYLVKKEEGAAGSVLGGGSFLRREGVPVLGERTKKERCLVGNFSEWRRWSYWLLDVWRSLFAPGACSTPREEVYT